jgi:putative CocE/NonD family hydrolase
MSNEPVSPAERRPSRVRFLAAPVLSIALLAAGGATAGAAPYDPGNSAAWQAAADAAPAYPGTHIEWDVPITMSDGITLKANVYRPADAFGNPVDEPLPTLVSLTPYTKLVAAMFDQILGIPGVSAEARKLGGLAFDGPLAPLSGFTGMVAGGLPQTFAVDRALIQSGYAHIVADVRGTGFSQGEWLTLGDRETIDTVEVIDWAAAQPWSNGRIGMSGISYSAINQLRAAELQPPALQAIFPVVPGNDLMRDIVTPGGGVGVMFLPVWLAIVNGLKWVPDIESIVQGRFDEKWLEGRLADPASMFDLYIDAMTTQDYEDNPNLHAILDPDSELRRDLHAEPEKITIPTFVVGGWQDIFVNGEPAIYNALSVEPGRKQLMMGDWYHITAGSGTGRPGAPPTVDALQRAWFDKWLKDIDNRIDEFGPVTVYRQGGWWNTLPAFPDPVAVSRRLYLSGAVSGTAESVYDGSLSGQAPSGSTALTVAPNLATVCSRDTAQQSMGVFSLVEQCAGDARPAETGALTFTTEPFADDVVLSGPVNVHLETILERPDGYWAVSINDVAPDGTSVQLASGQLDAAFRLIEPEKSGYDGAGNLVAPYYQLDLDAREPLEPGVPTPVDVAIPATDALLAAGHRLRLDVWASNLPKGMLLRPYLDESELAPQQVLISADRPSYVTVPLG